MSDPQFECPRCGHCCQALAQPEQEPVAWVTRGKLTMIRADAVTLDDTSIPLYIAPPKQWVGLTDEEVNELVARFKRYSYVLLREVEAKLKEKNHG